VRDERASESEGESERDRNFESVIEKWRKSQKERERKQDE
jgi:hypothetical protein